MTIKFSDYQSPQGLCVATGTALLPLQSAAGAAAFVGGAVQSGIGDQTEALTVQLAVEAAVAAALS